MGNLVKKPFLLYFGRLFFAIYQSQGGLYAPWGRREARL
jgi:hypothetical protein